MGQSVGRIESLGARVLPEPGDDGEWSVEIHGIDLRVFGDDLDVAAMSPGNNASFFVEAPDDAGPSVNSAVSELNGIVAEKDMPLDEALKLLVRLFAEAGVTAKDTSVKTATIEQIVAEDDSILQPQVHEASVMPSAGNDEDLEVAMDRMVASFQQVCSDLCATPMSDGEAAVILRHCKWDDADAAQRLRSDSEMLMLESGLASDGSKTSIIATGGKLQCGICFDDFIEPVADEQGLTLRCKHFFCNDCWKHQLEVVSKGGPAGNSRILDASCPTPGCNLHVGLSVYNKLGLGTLATSYRRALLRSFIEEGKAVVGCPGCARHVLLSSAKPDAGPCRHCGRFFCSVCFSDAHGPLTCAERRTWLTLVDKSKQNLVTRWASRLTSLLGGGPTETMARRCPNPGCNVMSQKIEGCLFLQCPRCREYWCWNCGDWGGGPSERPKPHHVFVCSRLPSDMTWLDGHSDLSEDARLEFFLRLYQERIDKYTNAKSVLNIAVEARSELEVVVPEAWALLRDCAAWRFFEHDVGQSRLFEFTEEEMLRLLHQVSQLKDSPRDIRSFYSDSQVRGHQRAMNLAGALRKQMQALRSYRRTGIP